MRIATVIRVVLTAITLMFSCSQTPAFAATMDKALQDKVTALSSASFVSVVILLQDRVPPRSGKLSYVQLSTQRRASQKDFLRYLRGLKSAGTVKSYDAGTVLNAVRATVRFDIIPAMLRRPDVRSMVLDRQLQEMVGY